MRTAIVIGATGLTGKHITRGLLETSFYSQVIVFTRRALDFEHDKLHQHVVNFDHIDEWSQLVQGDDIFSAMGTTQKQAGSQEAQYKVDYSYQAGVIEAAAANHVKRLFLISAPNANEKSSVFYSRIKGELDRFVSGLGFETVVLFKPSFIEGERMDLRIGEKIGSLILNATRWIPAMSRWKPISGEQLGSAIVNCAIHPLEPGIHSIQLDEIFDLLGSHT